MRSSRAGIPFASPEAHAPGVEVDEVGLGIVAHAAAAEGERDLPELAGWEAGQANINGLACMWRLC